MMFKQVPKLIRNVSILLFTVSLLYGQAVLANTIVLNSPTVLGGLDLSGDQLKKIKAAVEKAMTTSIDNEIQCGEVRLDCVVRAARQWTYEGTTYREIVVNIHTVGHASITVEKPSGQPWSAIAINGAEKKHAKK
jgi:hypothetical protein